MSLDNLLKLSITLPKRVDRVSVVVADPPWQFDDALPGEGRGASKHYPTMPARDIERFLIDHHAELPRINSNALLFMWRVGAMQQEALDVIQAWGFELKSEIVWVKTSRTSPELAFGMGHYTRWCHETCLIASRGQGSTLIRNRSVRSVFHAPIGRHSEKPVEFYRIVEQLTDGPWLELFARTPREGWVQHGNELPTMSATEVVDSSVGTPETDHSNGKKAEVG